MFSLAVILDLVDSTDKKFCACKCSVVSLSYCSASILFAIHAVTCFHASLLYAFMS